MPDYKRVRYTSKKSLTLKSYRPGEHVIEMVEKLQRKRFAKKLARSIPAVRSSIDFAKELKLDY